MSFTPSAEIFWWTGGRPRCSKKEFLPMSTADYLSLLDWTARQTLAGKRGLTPKQFAPLFDRLGISAEVWCRLVKDFGRLFSVVAGQPQRIDEHRSKDSSPLPNSPGNPRVAGDGVASRFLAGTDSSPTSRVFSVVQASVCAVRCCAGAWTSLLRLCRLKRSCHHSTGKFRAPA